jgi:type IV pilus assembly protein PilA
MTICSKCGAAAAEDSQFCSQCGNRLSGTPAAPPSSSFQAAAVAPAPLPAIPPGEVKTSGKAVASLVCGIINVFPLFIVAIVLGHISLSEIRKSAGRLKGEGLAIAGLVLGYLGVVAIPLILIIAAIAIPNLLRAKIAANEASAAASVRTILVAESSYAASHPSTGYTCNLGDLSSGIEDSRLLRGEKNGYVFTVQNCTTQSEGGPVSKFEVTASPISSASGRRAFCTDETGAIRSDRSGSAQECLNQGANVQ